MTLSFSNAVFISDLHLTEDRPDCIRAFFEFLDWLPSDVDSLFILGDFFEYWVGDDVLNELSVEVASSLSRIEKQKGIQIFFIAGNRDFSIGPSFCNACNMKPLKDIAELQIAGRHVSISHGDLFCTDDKKYQKFRKIIQNPWVIKSLLKLPYRTRVKIAEKLRQNSKMNFKKNQQIVDVSIETVENYFEKTGVEIVVHGHTHLADIHQYSLDNNTQLRMVLGDWHKTGWFGVINSTGPRLNQFSIEKPIFKL